MEVTSPGTDTIPSDGAEATVIRDTYLGLPAIRKTRVPKGYRAEAFDLKIRTERLRMEVRLLREARRAGIHTPFVFDVDEVSCSLVMERVPGRTLTDLFTDPEVPAGDVRQRVHDLGRTLGKLHSGGISHGDLTGSNVVWTGSEIAFLDLSMGSRTPELEDFGIDLHLVEEDFNTLLPDADAAFEEFLRGYQEGCTKDAKRNILRAREIKGRVRYS